MLSFGTNHDSDNDVRMTRFMTLFFFFFFLLRRLELKVKDPTYLDIWSLQEKAREKKNRGHPERLFDSRGKRTEEMSAGNCKPKTNVVH